jgi:hypothetical protein
MTRGENMEVLAILLLLIGLISEPFMKRKRNNDYLKSKVEKEEKYGKCQ